jgi:hypothetical protein
MRAGIDTDHATLGAAIGTENEDAENPKMVVKQVLEGSDAERRGIKDGDEVLRFGLKADPKMQAVTSTNQYKNVLGIYPKEWRVPVTLRRGNERHETLVRLMGNMATEKETAQPKLDGPAPKGPVPKGPVPIKGGGNPDAAAMYVTKKGYANWYFNELERKKLLEAFKKHGDFAAANGAWIAEGKYEMGERKGDFRFEITEKDAEPLVAIKLNIESKLSPLKDSDRRLQIEPIGSGGLMLALYQWHRFLTVGEKGFEGGFSHGGVEPFYPYPADGSTPKSLVSLRTDCEVLKTKHGSTDCKWFFSPKDHTLTGFETFIDKEKEDPCELFFSDYKAVDGKQLPHRIEVRYKDKRYCVLTVTKYTLGKK